MEKHSVSRLSYLFAHLHLLSSYSFSSTLLSSNLSLLSASSLLCFSSVHIVGSLTSKLPSIIYTYIISKKVHDIYIYIYICGHEYHTHIYIYHIYISHIIYMYHTYIYIYIKYICIYIISYHMYVSYIYIYVSYIYIICIYIYHIISYICMVYIYIYHI